MVIALRCPVCGAEIPSGFQHLPCPACAFRQALRVVSFDSSPERFGGNSDPTRPILPVSPGPSDHSPDARLQEDSGGGAEPPSPSTRDTYWRYRRWAIAAFVVVLAIYGGARLGWAQTTFDSRLHEQGQNAAEWLVHQYGGTQYLDEGALITRVNGISIDDTNEADLIIQAMKGDEVKLTVVDGGAAREQLMPTIAWNVQWARLAVGIVIGMLGALAFAMRPGGKSAGGFTIFCSYVAILWTLRAIPFFERRFLDDVLYDFTRLYLPVAALFFALTFTNLRGVFTHIRTPLFIMAVACTLLVPANVLIHGLPDNLLEDFNSIIWSRSVLAGWATLLVITIALQMPYKVWSRISGVPITPTERQRALVVRVAVLLSFAPSLLYTLVLTMLDNPDTTEVLSELVVLIFPVMMCYAIFRHNLLSINDLLLESTLYGLAIVALLGGYGAAAAAGATFLPEHDEWLRAGFVGLAAVVIVPLHNRIRGRIERRLSRVSFDYDALARLLDELSTQSLTAEDFCRRAAQLIARASHTSDINVILRRPGQRGLTITGMSPPPQSQRLLAECQILIEDLTADSAGYSIDDLQDDWSTDPRRSSSLKAMRELNASLVLPLSSHRQLIGALLVGSRVDFRNHTLGEVNTFRRLARHLAANLLHILNRTAAITGNRIADLYPACPQRIGRFAIDRVLGEGGMAIVFRGKSNEGWAAIKVCNRYVQSRSDLMERFHREGLAMRRLDHPNIVKVLEAGWEGPEPYIATEYLPGGSLEDLVRREGPLEENRALRYVADVARGLESALKQGIIHRDIKPRNLFITEDDHIKIGDFGLAQIADATTLTNPGEIMGTPHYISPEVMDGQAADWRSDQYALGMSFFYLLTGRYPFQANRIDALRLLYRSEEMPDLHTFVPQISTRSACLFERMTRRAPNDRFESFSELWKEIDG